MRTGRGRLFIATLILFGTTAALALSGASPALGEIPPEETHSGWYPAAGINWVRPLDSSVSDLYPGGVGFFGAMGYGWPGHLRVEVRMDWHRQTANPPNPFSNTSESRLTVTPVTLEGHYNIGNGTIRPYVAAGGGVLFTEEKFTYGIFEQTTAIGRRKNIIGLVGGGLEFRERRWLARASVRALLGSGDRDVLRATGRSDNRSGGPSASFLVGGLEFQLR